MSTPTGPSLPSTGSQPAPVAQLERLWPSPGVWLVVLLAAMLCAIVALPFGTVPGAVTFGVVAVGAAVLLIRSAPVVGVRDGEFVAQRAHVPVHLLGEITVLDAAQMRREHGPRLDARAYLCLRGWIRTGLRVDLTDPQDPTPYWLVSARRPERLAGAVRNHRREG